MTILQLVDWAILATLVFGGAWSIRVLYKNLSVRWVADKNDDEMVADLFVQLLQQAERDLVVHDDGDASEKSIYNDSDVVDALSARLRAVKKLRVRFFFNFYGTLEINRLATDFPERVEIRYRNPNGRPNVDVHYKIVDEGKAGYLSRHALGSNDRRYEFFNCAQAPTGERERIFGEFRRCFERDFSEAKAA